MKIHLTIFTILIFAVCAFGQTEAVSFDTYKLADIGTISIPSIMELQSKEYKDTAKDAAPTALKKILEASGDSIIFQQKGLNEFKKSGTYARILIDTQTGKPGDFAKASAKITATKQELSELSGAIKNQLQASLPPDLKIIRWDGVFLDTVNKLSVMKVSYLRQLKENPPVYVEMYYFGNNDRMHTLTVSYRQQDESLWSEPLKKSINSFTISNIR